MFSWLLFGPVAIIFAALNLVWMFRGKDPKWFRFLSMAFTALTLYDFYAMDAAWVAAEDWSALIDVVPAVSKALRICTGASILLNGITLLKRYE